MKTENDNLKKKANEQNASSGEKRLEKAKEDFKKMSEEIKPFLRRREFVQTSTDGKWFETSELSTVE